MTMCDEPTCPVGHTLEDHDRLGWTCPLFVGQHRAQDNAHAIAKLIAEVERLTAALDEQWRCAKAAEDEVERLTQAIEKIHDFHNGPGRKPCLCNICAITSRSLEECLPATYAPPNCDCGVEAKEGWTAKHSKPGQGCLHQRTKCPECDDKDQHFDSTLADYCDAQESR